MTPADLSADSAPRRFSLSIGTLTTLLVVSAVLLVSGLLTTLNYLSDVDFAERAAEEQFVAIARRTASAVSAFGLRGRSVANAARRQTVATLKTAPEELPDLSNLASLLNDGDSVFSIFLGFPDGSYLELSNLEALPGLREAWGAGEDDRWVAVRILDTPSGRVEIRDFLDAALVTHWSVTLPSSYRTTSRPWYQQALAVEGVSTSAPYTLSMISKPGISHAVEVSDGVVAGAIVLLSSLEQLLANNRYPETYSSLVFSTDAQLIAASTAEEANPLERNKAVQRISSTVLPALLEFASEQRLWQTLLRRNINGEDYFGYVQPLSKIEGDASEDFIGLTVKRDEVLAPFLTRAVNTVATTLGIVVLLLIPVLLVTRVISNPIRKLISENRKVETRNYDAVAGVDSRITEVAALSRSLVTMSATIKEQFRQQQALRDGIIRLIADAIDQKSPYTGGHCHRVPELAFALAEAASRDTGSAFERFVLNTEEEWREFKVAAWLHDCGKITTPEHIMDKGSKLEAIYDRIHEIRMRFEVLLRDARIDFLEAVAEAPARESELRDALEQTRAQLIADFEFVAQCNVGGEAMGDTDIARLKAIGQRTWVRQLDNRIGLSPAEARRLADWPSATPAEEPLLADKPEHRVPHDRNFDHYEALGFTLMPPEHKQNLGELYNLSVRRGTLTAEDRYLINDHISATIQMLEALPWPDELSRVAEYAGGHHEKMDGTGYPRSLRGAEMSVPARIMAIADIFEALTAADRPYKKAKPLSQSLEIMSFMARDQHIDPDLYRLFLRSGVWRDYGDKFLEAEQCDRVDVDALLRTL